VCALVFFFLFLGIEDRPKEFIICVCDYSTNCAKHVCVIIFFMHQDISELMARDD